MSPNISNFFSANYFKRSHEEMLEKHGKLNKFTNLPNVLIPITISEDEAAMNATRNKSEEILVLKIMNFYGCDALIDLLGISPKCPMSNFKMHEYLHTVMQCHSATCRTKVISLTKREIHFSYLQECLKPINVLSDDKGFILQIGFDELSYKVHAFVKLAFLSGDNKSLDDLLSIKPKGMFIKHVLYFQLIFILLCSCRRIIQAKDSNADYAMNPICYDLVKRRKSGANEAINIWLNYAMT